MTEASPLSASYPLTASNTTTGETAPTTSGIWNTSRRRGNINEVNNGKLAEKIRLILVDAIDNPCGGLVASEIQMALFDEGIEVSLSKIANVIRWRGRHIKIQPITMPGNKWMNLYYTSPQLNLNKETEK